MTAIDAELDTVASALAGGGEPRAGGTDLTARDQLGRATRPFVDLRGVPGLRGVQWQPDGSARIGAMTTVAELASDARLLAAYPALTAAAAGLATPQVRAAATLGGNLLQRNRCWYYRNPHFSCHQSGGDGCPARDGVHLYSAVIDLGPCVAPHASTLAVALLAHDGTTLEVHRRGTLPVAELYDGTDPTRDHTLAAGQVLLAVTLPPPLANEGAAYHRATARAESEWPLVEAVARLVIDATTPTTAPSPDPADTTVPAVGPVSAGTVGTADPAGPAGTVVAAAVAVGGVARTPLRLPEVEAALVGGPAAAQALAAAAALATERCTPLPQTGYKVGLLRDTVLEVLERAAAAARDIRDHGRRAD